ncbi:MAG: hypothetical protein AAF601_10050 [Pseudomonadota bacterium]
MFKLLSFIVATFVLSVQLHAATVNIVATENAGNVIFTGSGSVDLTGIRPLRGSSLNVSRSQFNLFGGLSGSNQSIGLPVTFTPLSASFINFDSISGDNFFVQGLNSGGRGFLGLNTGYVSGSAIDFVWTANSTTLADLALNFGTVAQFGNNTVTLSDGSAPAAVPLPASLPLLVGAMGLSLLCLRRRKRA